MKAMGFHALDKVCATAIAIASVASVAYFVLSGQMATLESPDQVFMVIATMIVFGFVLEGLQVVGLRRHARWGFGLVAGLYVLGFLGSVFILIVHQTTNASLPPRSLFTWHDMYLLPIAAFCAYRYYTYERFEGTQAEAGDVKQD